VNVHAQVVRDGMWTKVAAGTEREVKPAHRRLDISDLPTYKAGKTDLREILNEYIQPPCSNQFNSATFSPFFSSFYD